MNLTKEQCIKLAEKVFVNAQCPHCGCDEKPSTPFEFIEQKTFIPNPKQGSEEKTTVFLTYSCPKCGFTTFINLKTIGII